jgi:hypothetical protein
MRFSPGFAAYTLTLTLVLAGTPLVARADLTPGVSVGTTGINVSLGAPIGSRFDARMQYGSLSYNTSVTSSDNTYQGQIRLHSFLFLADYHPFGSTFALATGFCFPNYSLAAALVPNADGSFTLNRVTFTGINSVGGTIAWNNTAPYFGIAWVPTRERHGLSFTADLGAAFVGSPQVHIVATGPGASNPLVQSGMAAETQSLENSANFRVFPIVNVGLVYRFGSGDDSDKEPRPNPARAPENKGNEFAPTAR